jgi:hypothetical protein
VKLTDVSHGRTHVLVEKFDPDASLWVTRHLPSQGGRRKRIERVDFERFKIQPYGTAETDNLLTTAGLTRLVSLLNGAGGQAMTNTATRIGTGNGAGSAAVGDTDLGAAAGSANRWFQIMDATFPSAAAAVLTSKSTFASADGNYAWNEWGMDIGTPTVTSSAVVAATFFNHKTSAALGTKTAGASWALTATTTFS